MSNAPSGYDLPSRRDRRWDPLLVAVVGYVLIGVGQVHVLIPGLSVLRLGLVVALASILLFVLDGHRERRATAVFDPASIAVVALLAWATVTVPFALHASMAYTALADGFSRTVLLYVVIIASIRGRRDVERLSLAYFSGVVMYSFYTFTLSPLSGPRVDLNIGSYDANDFATFAVTGIPLSLYFMRPANSLGLRVFAVAGLVLITLGVVLSGSRGGFLALVATAAYILFRYGSIPFRWRLGSLATAIILMVGLGSDSYWERMQTILNPQDDYNVTDETGRTQTWVRGLGYAKQHPIAGVGLANFVWAEATISPLARRQERGVGVKALAPHNSYVQIVAELGVVGFSLFVFVLYRGFTNIRTARRQLERSDPSAAPLADALTAALVGLLVGIFFLSHAYSSMSYAVLGLAIGFGKAGRLAMPRVDPTLRRSR